MTDNHDRNDPWAPPGRPAAPQGPADAGGPAGQGPVDLGKAGPPPVHQQPTVASMPAPGFTAPQGPGDVPPPPVAPGGPGQPAPGAYGYPAPPAAGQPGGAYGYPAGHPGYGPYGQGGWGPAPNNGMGITAMVLGIVSLVMCWLWGLGIILGALALVFGIIARKRVQRGESTNGAFATAGIVTGSVGIVLGAVILGAMIWAIVQEENRSGQDDPYRTALVVAEASR
ncbi:hypothetical protein BJP40_17805 [Streptomyces sp. CC53]|uniref:DUF4190 domain-containing protein n=1 Tax=unclassified Streptomyces TaxID=2593676 RepID=UPI0008DCE4FC|nr:hypothetical protein BJP40_17805 [Streptomyces sp. CC53]